jgi:hypothetical protein
LLRAGSGKARSLLDYIYSPILAKIGENHFTDNEVSTPCKENNCQQEESSFVLNFRERPIMIHNNLKTMVA